MADSAMSSANSHETFTNINFDKQSLASHLSDCLHMSNVFTLAGFETVNDKILLEMNERAKSIQSHKSITEYPAITSTKSPKPKSKDAVHPHLKDFARINRSPPENRFSAAHNREFAHSASIVNSPYSKRRGTGEESPSKRRRAQEGRAIEIMHSPTKSLEELTLDNRDRLDQVSAARLRAKQRRDLQTSPRRRLNSRVASSPHPSMEPSLSRSIPPLELDIPPPRSVSAGSKPVSEPIKRMSARAPTLAPPRPLLKPPAAKTSMPRSQSLRSLSGPATHIQQSTEHSHSTADASTGKVFGSKSNRSIATLLNGFPDNLPSYARPTQAALRKSNSVNHSLDSASNFRTNPSR